MLFFDKHMSHLQGTSDKLGFINSGKLADSDCHRHDFTKYTHFTVDTDKMVPFLNYAQLFRSEVISYPHKEKNWLNRITLW